MQLKHTKKKEAPRGARAATAGWGHVKGGLPLCTPKGGMIRKNHGKYCHPARMPRRRVDKKRALVALERSTAG